ncbi:hypothetical protein K491DRAFT_776987 [Lophiostoma macrostomum CBS 122681]|uniref:Mediator of RNA polymerase II transcription subunit 13 n=1 Tax=Lophiostoma macrostomum CBS 122681 TaxID=1314788 RepID=A0A6A6TEN5_9PLEO|nr:hypothetical protein K491DRAFT_776987 [Lophiostoma macrostomum CBS 122681]
MEFLKTCNTNAQAIGDFEAVAYHAFSVRRNPTHSASPLLDHAPSEDVRAVQAHLRQERHFVIQDASRPWLWMFRSTSSDQVGQKPYELPVVEGYDFQREQSGFMKASELARPPIRTANPNTPQSATGPSPSTPGGLQQPLHDIFSIYELFTSSVVALVSYYLVKDHGAVALNYRTFLIKSATETDSVIEEQHLSAIPLRLTNVNVYWLSSGTLVVSSVAVNSPAIHNLDTIPEGESQDQIVGKCVRIGPNGALAQVVSFDDPTEASPEENKLRKDRKRLRIGPAEQGIERWKTAVRRWLSWKGYSTTALDKPSSWVKIRTAPLTSSYQSRPVLWPRFLCFFYDDSTHARGTLDLLHKSRAAIEAKALEWFETPHSVGFRNPVDVAQQWFLGKPERDAILEARRRAQKAEEEAIRPKEEHPGGLFPSSPLNSRTGAYGDLQAVSGVYPTPPDGVPPGAVVSGGDASSISATAASTILVPGGSNPAINLSAPQEHFPSEGQQQLPTSPEFPTSFDAFHAAGSNDDLFEDADDVDGYVGNGITDADFNFFDEPDGDDAAMPDAPIVEDTKSTTTLKKLVKEAENAQQSEVDIKEDMSDPMAALEDALATPSRPSPEQIEDIKMEDAGQDGFPTEGVREELRSPKKQSAFVEPRPPPKPAKDHTPPLSPHRIRQSLLPSPKAKDVPKTPEGQTSSSHRDSVFDPVSFSRKMSLSDAKYQGGRFGVAQQKPATDMQVDKEPSKGPPSLKDLPLVTRLRYAVGIAANSKISEVKALTCADGDLSDSTSDCSSMAEEDDDDIISLPAASVSSGLRLSGKRKLPTDGNATPMSATSLASSFGGDGFDFDGLQTDEGALVLLDPTRWDWPMINLPPPIELRSNSGRYTIPSFSPLAGSMPNTPTSQPDLTLDIPDEKPLSAMETISIAQMVTEQIVYATLDILHEKTLSTPSMSGPSQTYTKLHPVIHQLFPKSVECSVQSLVSLPDVFPDLAQAKGQQRPPARKPNDGPPLPSYHIIQIAPPHIRVRRADMLWDMLPPALPFWESLGLSPCSPAKNVVAFCIYPFSESLRPCVEHFMLNLQITYEGCRLGSHIRTDTLPDYEGGLVPCKVSHPVSSRTAFRSLRETCAMLGRLLSAQHAQIREDEEGRKIDAFVIYMIDPFEDTSAIWELCSAFWTLFQTYGQGPSARPELVPKPDLVLQIIPIKYIASFDAPVILEPSTYASLAREVYDRCPPSEASRDKTPLSIYAAPSFQLEEAIPRGIPFRLNSEPPQDLLRENSYIHLGYAISLDGSWITAAWTDNCGKSRAVVSYNLGTRPFGEIAREIWQTTIEILQARRVTWRVCIAKCGVMDRDECEAWTSLTSCPTQVNLFITLLSVDPNPPLKFTPTMPSTNAPNAGAAQTNTPGSTPQPTISPDPHSLTPAATPSADNITDPTNDPEARLVDLTDESWGIILSHRLHNTNSTVEFRPCLISGLLVKRGQTQQTSSSPGPDPERGPIVVGVNIIWVGAVNSTRAAASPFPPATDGVSPGGVGLHGHTAANPNPNPAIDRDRDRPGTSLMWTPTPQMRATAENLLKEVLAQFRALGVLARLKGVRGSRMGTVPWHVAVAQRGVEGLGVCLPG